MYTKLDFDTAAQNVLTNYPTVSARYKVGDPTVLAQLSAMSQMLAMMSQQLEIAQIEPFSKVRDATILADAALRGLIPKGTPARVQAAVANADVNPYTLASGRSLTDSAGNEYVVDTPVTVPAGGSGMAQFLQQTQQTLTHTVANSQPFYQILIPQAPDGSFLAGISVADAAGNEYKYTPGFTNVPNGAQVYNVEIDEYQNIFVRFGYGGVIGFQPNEGDVYEVTLTYTLGPVTPATGSPFSLDYTLTVQDSLQTITMDSMLIDGEAPMDITTLRELAKYPSAYDNNAVYLGEFDYLIRSNIPSLLFLSVWNEQEEELVRGANEDNINCLFVSFQPPLGGDVTAYETQITALIQGADDSYKIKFVPPVVEPIVCAITATVARIYDSDAVDAQIESVMLANYGQSALAVTSGGFSVQYKAVYQLLRAQIVALQDSNSDFNVVITPPTDANPEDYRYMTSTSLTVAVALADFKGGSWGT